MLRKLKPAMDLQDSRSFELPGDVSLCDLQAAKVRLLYEKLWQPVISSLVVAALMSAIVWSSNSASSIFCWLAALIAISLLRLWLAYRYKYVTANPHKKKWLYAFAAGTLLSGTVWGAASILFFNPEYPAQVAAIAIVMAGVAAGGTTTLSSVRWIALGFVVQILLPLPVLLFMQATLLSSLVGTMVLIFLMLMLATSTRFYEIIHDNIALRVSIQAREAQLLESENRYRSIFDHSPLGVLHFDRNGTITDCNEQMLKILGGERQAFIGYRMLDRLANQEVAQGVRDALENDSGYFEGTFFLPGAETGTPLRAIFNGVNCARNRRIGGMAIVEDFTERTRNEAIIYRQAYYDALTDLPNRRLFIERLIELGNADNNPARTGAVMFLDMDRFKLINDTLGHAAGDDLLVQVAKRLEQNLEEEDMAARLSGDEFVLLALFDEPSLEAVEHAAEAYMRSVQTVLSGRYHLESQYVQVTPSMGYTCFEVANFDHTEILKQADMAMYQAKSEGRARLRRYQPEMQTFLESRFDLEKSATSPVDR